MNPLKEPYEDYEAVALKHEQAARNAATIILEAKDRWMDRAVTAEAKVAELEAQRDEARGIAIECNEQIVELEARLSEHPIHGPVTISVTDDTRKLDEALEEIKRLRVFIRDLQWLGPPRGNNCPWCGNYRSSGHEELCRIAKEMMPK